MKLAPGVRLIQIPEDMPGRVYSTNIYLIGEKQLILLDVGDGSDRHVRSLFQYLMELGPQRQIVQAVVSHSHIGHYGGLRWVRESIGPQFRAHPAAIPLLEKSGGKDSLTPLEEGEILEADGMELEVLFTPGHTPDSLCLFDKKERALFSTDTILGGSTTTVSDLASFMASLERLLALGPRAIYPAHGVMVQDGVRAIEEYITHRKMRERQIAEQLQKGPKTVRRLVQLLYANVDKRLHGAARGNVRQHLAKLRNEGRAGVEGTGYRAKYYWAE